MSAVNRTILRVACWFLFLAFCVAWIGSASAPSARASHVPSDKDVPGIRTPLPEQGYLQFTPAGFANGAERTGWIDIRHPAYASINVTDTSLGYDRSDRIIQVHNKIVSVDLQGVPGVPLSANPNILRDYDFAGQIYAQAGISVLSTGTQLVDHTSTNTQGNTPVEEPIVVGTPFPDDQDKIQLQNRQAAPVVNNYYAPIGEDQNGDPLRGVAAPPTNFPAQSGVMVFDSAANDTFAHEVGHFLLDNHQFNNPGNTAHSPNPTDLMADGTPRVLPGNTQKGDGNTAPADPGRPNGNLGTTSRFDDAVKLGGAGADIHQINAIMASPFVQATSNASAGSRADFNFVEDNIYLETLGGAADDNPGFDFLVWGIGPVPASNHTTSGGHDHGNWGELALDAFAGADFWFADVVSLTARYADMDVNPATGNWSARNSALDYLIQFSADGTSWSLGILDTVFIEGWTMASDAENYLARWRSPFAAQYVRIQAAPGPADGHQLLGATQIDAVIVGVPEPSSVLFASLAAVGISFYVVRRKRRAR